MVQIMKIIVTGAHFTPAQAVITELTKDPSNEIIYLGRKYTREGDSSPSVESKVLPELGIKFIPITTGRLQRSFTIYTIPSLLKIPIGLIQSFYYLIKYRPHVVLGFGGYLSVPVVTSAWLLSIPIIIHEQTLVEGLSNKINSWFATKIAVSFNTVHKNQKTVLTGNPMRSEVFAKVDLVKVSKEYREIVNLSRKSKLPLILITGGNQGSHIINQTIAEILPQLTKIACVIHQTGVSKFNDYQMLDDVRGKLTKPENYLVTKWIDVSDMVYIFSSVDLAISRAGINTLQELAYFQIPSLVIPLPFVQKDEQTINAKYFEKLGLAQVLLQSKLSPSNLLEQINKMINELSSLQSQAKPAKQIVIEDAAKRLALETVILAK